MNFLEKQVKEILTNFNGRNIIEEILPKKEFYSVDSYGKFEGALYKDKTPKEYFSSKEWNDKFKELVMYSDIGHGFKKELKDRVDNFFDSELKFFGDSAIIESFKEKNKSLMLGMYNELNKRLLETINDTYELDDFDEALDSVLYDEFAKSNKLTIENLYPEKIKLYYNTSNVCFIDETFLYAEDGLLKLTTENVTLLSKLVNLEELKEVLLANNRIYENDIEEQASEGYDTYSEISTMDKKENISFSDIYKALNDSKYGFYPVFYVETNYDELSKLKNKKVQARDLDNASLILVESTNIKPKVIKLGKLNALKINLDTVQEETGFLERFDIDRIENQLNNTNINKVSVRPKR